MISELFGNVEGVYFYIDDLLVTGKNFKDNYNKLIKVLKIIFLYNYNKICLLF